MVEVLLRCFHLTPSEAGVFTGHVVGALLVLVNDAQVSVAARHGQRDMGPTCNGCTQNRQMVYPEVRRHCLIQCIDQQDEVLALLGGCFASCVHRPQQDISTDRLKSEVVSNTRPKVAAAEPRSEQHNSWTPLD